MAQAQKTKIICTTGPACNNATILAKMAKNGMNLARLNFSHGDHKDHKKLIKEIKKAEKLSGKTIAIIQDLQGPKIRAINIEEPLLVKKNQVFNLEINYPEILKNIKKNERVLIDDGLISAVVVKKSKDKLVLKALNKGKITNGRGVNLPDSKINLSTITKKDLEDLKFGLKQGVDYVALSFVKSEKDVLQLRKLTEKAKNPPKIIAKIERREALDNLEKIVKHSDAVMVARGDLGVEIALEEVPLAQKKIIALSNHAGKPVITATQVLYSMIDHQKATRAEISDAANAVFDHSDAIMLSNETATGMYPLKAVQTLHKVATTIENEMASHPVMHDHFNSKKHLNTTEATCLNACEIAEDTKIDYIVACCSSGFTASQISKNRPYTPVITIVNDKKTKRQLTLNWGLNKIFVEKFRQKDQKKITAIKKWLLKQNLVKKGQKIVLICNVKSEQKLISTLEI
jgi:pyruvate kinase